MSCFAIGDKISFDKTIDGNKTRLNGTIVGFLTKAESPYTGPLIGVRTQANPQYYTPPPNMTTVRERANAMRKAKDPSVNTLTMEEFRLLPPAEKEWWSPITESSRSWGSQQGEETITGYKRVTQAFVGGSRKTRKRRS
jgi:hypothetical protein